jgi:hypothetical protein
VFDIEAASTISVLTNDDTKSKASSQLRRKKNQGKAAGQVSSTRATVTEHDGCNDETLQAQTT